MKLISIHAPSQPQTYGNLSKIMLIPRRCCSAISHKVCSINSYLSLPLLSFPWLLCIFRTTSGREAGGQTKKGMKYRLARIGYKDKLYHSNVRHLQVCCMAQSSACWSAVSLYLFAMLLLLLLFCFRASDNAGFKPFLPRKLQMLYLDKACSAPWLERASMCQSLEDSCLRKRIAPRSWMGGYCPLSITHTYTTSSFSETFCSEEASSVHLLSHPGLWSPAFLLETSGTFHLGCQTKKSVCPCK